MRGAWLSFEDKLGACLRVQLIRTLTASNTAGVDIFKMYLKT